MQYVGEIENILHNRMYSNHSDMRIKKQVAAHSSKPDHSTEREEDLVIVKYTRTITRHAQNNRKLTVSLDTGPGAVWTSIDRKQHWRDRVQTL